MKHPESDRSCNLDENNPNNFGGNLKENPAYTKAVTRQIIAASSKIKIEMYP